MTGKRLLSSSVLKPLVSKKIEDSAWESRDVGNKESKREMKKRKVGLGVMPSLYTQDQVEHETERSPVPR